MTAHLLKTSSGTGEGIKQRWRQYWDTETLVPMHILVRKTEMAMNCELEDLPDELLIEILSFLPWSEVMRFRMVGVKWNELLRSLEFRRRWRGRDSSLPPLCFIGCNEFGLSVYNPSRHSWQVIGPSYPSSFFTFTNESGGSYQTTNVRVVGAAHGLLLLQVFLHVNTEVPVKIELFVMNPLDPSTKKRIPLLPQLEDHFTSKALGIVWDEMTHSHQILLQYRPDPLDPSLQDSREIKMWAFYSYDLQEEKWEQVARWPGDRVREFQHPSMKKGRFYCLGKDSLSILPHKFRPYVLDNTQNSKTWLKEPTWIEDENPSIPRQVQFATLCHDDRGSLLACGHVQSKYYVDFGRRSVLKKFSIWKLQTEKLAQKSAWRDSEEENHGDNWVQLYEMPEALVQKVNDGNPTNQFQCAATDKFVCVANSMREGAIFDIKKKLWWTLPRHPLNYSTDSPVRGELLNWLAIKKLDLHLCEPRFDILL